MFPMEFGGKSWDLGVWMHSSTWEWGWMGLKPR